MTSAGGQTQTGGGPEGTDPHPLAVGLVRVLSGRAASLALSFMGWALMARGLGPSSFGFVQFGVSVTFFVAFLTDLGLTTLGTRELARSGGGPLLIGRILGLRLLLAVAAAGIAAVLFASLTPGEDERRAWLVLMSTVVASAASAVWILRAQNKAASLAIVDVAASAVLFGGALLLVNAEQDLLIAVGVFALAQWIATAMSLRSVGDSGWLRPVLRGSLGLLRRAAPLGVAVLAITVYYYADSTLLGLLRTPEEVGFYGAAYRLVFPWLTVASTVGLLAMPQLAEALDRGTPIRPLLDRMAKLSMSLAIPVAVGGTVAASTLVTLVFGERYSPAALPFSILIWSCVTVFANAPFGFLLLARHRDRAYMLIALAGAAVNIVLNLALIPRIGMTGAAIATISAEVVVLGAMLWATRDVSVQVLGSALRFGVPIGLVTGLAMWPFRTSVLALVIGAAVFFAACAVLRVVRIDEVRQVASAAFSRESPR